MSQKDQIIVFGFEKSRTMEKEVKEVYVAAAVDVAAVDVGC